MKHTSHKTFAPNAMQRKERERAKRHNTTTMKPQFNPNDEAIAIPIQISIHFQISTTDSLFANCMYVHDRTHLRFLFGSLSLSMSIYCRLYFYFRILSPPRQPRVLIL